MKLKRWYREVLCTLYPVSLNVTCVYSCKYHYNQNNFYNQKQNNSITTKIFLMLPLYSHNPPPNLPNPWTPPICSPVFKFYHFREYYINVINQYVTFWDWLFLLSIMPMISIQVVVCVWSLLFLLLSSIPWNGCTIVCLTTHILRDIWVIFIFSLLQIALLWTFMDRFLYGWKFSFLWDTCPGVRLLSCMVSLCLVL